MVGEVRSYCDKHLVKLITHGGVRCELLRIAIGLKVKKEIFQVAASCKTDAAVIASSLNMLHYSKGLASTKYCLKRDPEQVLYKDGLPQNAKGDENLLILAKGSVSANEKQSSNVPLQHEFLFHLPRYLMASDLVHQLSIRNTGPCQYKCDAEPALKMGFKWW
ncbi:hypothetical protein llap_4606 [Limosa lapponica baueri]|uniref:Uncharacterized protein n=1 Tax=Limosa lapponica baueri TaxID=1758121 RepID=A0A2I0UGC8_LIMLA|nr:hypothetical protein llap_4606 [Limosa lapponica baueri]